MSEWQPIETAPFDGTAVLVAWSDVAGNTHIGICWNEGSGWYPFNRPATHWQPLPTPPTVQKDEGR